MRRVTELFAERKKSRAAKDAGFEQYGSDNDSDSEGEDLYDDVATLSVDNIDNGSENSGNDPDEYIEVDGAGPDEEQAKIDRQVLIDKNMREAELKIQEAFRKLNEENSVNARGDEDNSPEQFAISIDPESAGQNAVHRHATMPSTLGTKVQPDSISAAPEVKFDKRQAEIDAQIALAKLKIERATRHLNRPIDDVVVSSAESKPPEMIHIPQFFERDGTIHGKTSPEGTPPDAVPAFDPTTFQAGLEEAFANAVDEQGIYVNPDDLEAVPGAVENSHSALYSTVEGSDNLGEPSYSDPEGVDTPGASGVEPFDSGDEPEWSDSESENDDPSGPVLDGYGDGEDLYEEVSTVKRRVKQLDGNLNISSPAAVDKTDKNPVTSAATARESSVASAEPEAPKFTRRRTAASRRPTASTAAERREDLKKRRAAAKAAVEASSIYDSIGMDEASDYRPKDFGLKPDVAPKTHNLPPPLPDFLSDPKNDGAAPMQRPVRAAPPPPVTKDTPSTAPRGPSTTQLAPNMVQQGNSHGGNNSDA